MAGSVHCPQCDRNIEQDFGVVICPQCGAVVMIDIDGNVKLATEASESMIQETPQLIAERTEEQQVEYQDLQFENPTPAEEAETSVMEAGAPTDDFTDVIQFGNSDLSQGLLKYTVIIEKIDTGDRRAKLKEVISDNKMKLNVDQLMKEIQKGKLEIKNLNPVKASLIVQRLRETDLEISWSQYAFTS